MNWLRSLLAQLSRWLHPAAMRFLRWGDQKMIQRLRGNDPEALNAALRAVEGRSRDAAGLGDDHMVILVCAALEEASNFINKKGESDVDRRIQSGILASYYLAAIFGGQSDTGSLTHTPQMMLAFAQMDCFVKAELAGIPVSEWADHPMTRERYSRLRTDYLTNISRAGGVVQGLLLHLWEDKPEALEFVARRKAEDLSQIAQRSSAIDLSQTPSPRPFM